MSRLGPTLGSHCKDFCLGGSPIAWMGTTVVPVGVAVGRKDPSGRVAEAGSLPWIPPLVLPWLGVQSVLAIGATERMGLLPQQRTQYADIATAGYGCHRAMGQMAGQTLPSSAGATARSKRGPPGFPPPLFQVGTGLGLLPQIPPSPRAPGCCPGPVGNSRDQNLLHIIDDLLAHHDDQELLCQLDETASCRTLHSQAPG